MALSEFVKFVNLNAGVFARSDAERVNAVAGVANRLTRRGRVRPAA